MKTRALVGLIVVIAAVSLAGCKKYCEKAKATIIDPLHEVMTFLETNPDGATLAATGCSYMLEKVKTIPDGSNLVRTLAERRYSHALSHCLQWVQGDRWVCRPYGHVTQCWWETYSYCSQWETDIIHDPEYSGAVEFSQNLDSAYAQVNGACADAATGNVDGAYNRSRTLLNFLLGTVKPQGETIWARECGS